MFPFETELGKQKHLEMLKEAERYELGRECVRLNKIARKTDEIIERRSLKRYIHDFMWHLTPKRLHSNKFTDTPMSSLAYAVKNDLSPYIAESSNLML